MAAPLGPRLDDQSALPVSVPGALDGASVEQSAEELFATVVDAVRSVVLVDERTVQLAVGGLLAGGHLLIEDLPGTGKTTFTICLAGALGLGFRRIQCTADLLPSDVTGALVIDGSGGGPVFRPGPVFTNVLMADELNRAPARAQSAFLEAMEERQVTVDGQTRPLPRPFLVIATQNPYDDVGTAELPHGQRDRFLLRLSIGYPSRGAEQQLLAGPDRAGRARALPAALSAPALRHLMGAVASVHVSNGATEYVLDLLEATRRHPAIAVGASPRAGLAVVRAARAMAVATGRDFVAPQDVQLVAGSVLGHRLLLEMGSELAGGDAAAIVAELLDQVPIPAAERLAPTQ